MWMCYAEQSWTKAVDKLSVAERLKDEFLALEFDAQHEMVYRYNVFDIEYLENLVKKYLHGIEICEEFINGGCGSCFVRKLIEAGLKEFITGYLKFFPEAEQPEAEQLEGEQPEIYEEEKIMSDGACSAN